MKFADSVKQLANLTSTATITPGAAAVGFRTWTQAIADTAGKPEQVAVGDTVCNRVDDVTDPSKWEVADYTIGGTAQAPTLTRGTIHASSNAGVAVVFGGPVTVLCTVPSNYLVGLLSAADGVADAQLPAASTLSDSDILPITQGTATVRTTLGALKTYLGAAASTGTGGTSSTAPGAPTIGTAVAGDGYVDVAFTPGAAGSTATLDYTAALSTGQAATGTTSPIRVTASDGTAVTATVKARNATGYSPASAASNSVTPAAAASGGASTYTPSRYDGGTIPLPAGDVTTGTTKSAAGASWVSIDATVGISKVGYQLFGLAPAPAKIASGWGPSNTSAPALVVTGQTQTGSNVQISAGYVAIQSPGAGSDANHSNITPPTWAWLPGTPGTYSLFYWLVPCDASGNAIPGAAICVDPTTPWIITVTA